MAPSMSGNDEQAPPPVLEFHVCMGLNSCKGHGKDGSGDMAGTGRCSTVYHVCHGANSCRGQGACGYLGDSSQQGSPGANTCKGLGSCATPINEGRVSSLGVNRGKRVWKLARRLFEQRMYDAGVPFGPSPGDGVADDIVPQWGANSTGCASKVSGDPQDRPPTKGA
jgi:hypothetical protein